MPLPNLKPGEVYRSFAVLRLWDEDPDDLTGSDVKFKWVQHKAEFMILEVYEPQAKFYTSRRVNVNILILGTETMGWVVMFEDFNSSNLEKIL